MAWWLGRLKFKKNLSQRVACLVPCLLDVENTLLTRLVTIFFSHGVAFKTFAIKKIKTFTTAGCLFNCLFL